MRRELKGRRLLITGASSGIGRCIAEQAARAGARLVVTARSGKKLDELTRAFPEVMALPGDITEPDHRQQLLRTAAERLGGLDALINNAGVASFGHFATSTEEILRKIMEVNFFAPAELIRGAIPLLAEGNQPAILNIVSMCGRCAMPAWLEYSASKFAFCGLSEALRAEMARHDIAVLVVNPGLTRTPFRDNQLRKEGMLKLDEERGQEPAVVAAAAFDALKRNRAETVVGSDAKWMIRVHRWLPGLFARLLARKVRQLYAGS